MFKQKKNTFCAYSWGINISPIFVLPNEFSDKQIQMWLNVVTENKDVLGADQNINWFYMLGFSLSLFSSTSGYEFSEGNMSNSG